LRSSPHPSHGEPLVRRPVLHRRILGPGLQMELNRDHSRFEIGGAKRISQQLSAEALCTSTKCESRPRTRVVRFAKVPSCPNCREQLTTVPEDATASFACEKCGAMLHASVRYRMPLLLFGAALGAVLRFSTLVLNPRTNVQKTALIPFVMESLLVRRYWRTRLVKIASHQAPAESIGPLK
jgi:predicted RNA-binding Zn-ribbon protein involved in translation (DUF1610 family)